MAIYILRRTDLSDDSNDYVFRCDGIDVGRCYLRTLSNNEQAWSWTVYIGWHVKRLVPGVPIAGYAATLDDAKLQFMQCFERLIAAGAITLT